MSSTHYSQADDKNFTKLLLVLSTIIHAIDKHEKLVALTNRCYPIFTLCQLDQPRDHET